ncbi:hypothetical protein RHGRI_021836 [Rhododendron griersonianum]|uniref:Uncharacterized protein n=1 Tax=Rhododendron griersonianum TaxID=479676 RepID=A0AAV6JQZ2_9ERIC|nr:hypothetical protein RHGRI_021836 [Rhododendron griersonianum]
MSTPTVQTISECFIKPQYSVEEVKPPIHLAAWDLAMLSVNYIQKGLLFIKPQITRSDQENPVESLLNRLKDSLSLTLVHFYPLAGRLTTLKQENPPSYSVYIDCNNSPGAKFIYATADLTIADILSPVDVPIVVQSFFDHDRAINHDGHSMSLLSIQVTELIDGVFIGCSANHAVIDGTSYWQFFEILSHTFAAEEKNPGIPRPPILKRWFPNGHGPIHNLPFSHHGQFISRFEAPPLRERIFHFSSESIAKLKTKANSESKSSKISSFQTVSALVWRCVIRARCLPRDPETTCIITANNRSRMDPPLPNEYFGNSVLRLIGKASVGDLLDHGLGWAAWQLHEAVEGHSDVAVREWVEKWMEDPVIYTRGPGLYNPYGLLMGSLLRFGIYENEFGMGKAVAIRSGYANKFDGKVMLYPGYEGRGSMDLEDPKVACHVLVLTLSLASTQGIGLLSLYKELDFHFEDWSESSQNGTETRFGRACYIFGITRLVLAQQVLEMKRQLAQLNLEQAQKKQVLEGSNQEASKPKLPPNTYKEAISREGQPQYIGNLVSLGNKPMASLKAQPSQKGITISEPIATEIKPWKPSANRPMTKDQLELLTLAFNHVRRGTASRQPIRSIEAEFNRMNKIIKNIMVQEKIKSNSDFSPETFKEEIDIDQDLIDPEIPVKWDIFPAKICYQFFARLTRWQQLYTSFTSGSWEEVLKNCFNKDLAPVFKDKAKIFDNQLIIFGEIDSEIFQELFEAGFIAAFPIIQHVGRMIQKTHLTVQEFTNFLYNGIEHRSIISADQVYGVRVISAPPLFQHERWKTVGEFNSSKPQIFPSIHLLQEVRDIKNLQPIPVKTTPGFRGINATVRAKGLQQIHDASSDFTDHYVWKDDKRILCHAEDGHNRSLLAIQFELGSKGFLWDQQLIMEDPIP